MAAISGSVSPLLCGFMAPVCLVFLLFSGVRWPCASRVGACPTPFSWHWAQRCLNRAAPSEAAGAWAKADPDSAVAAAIASPSVMLRAIPISPPKLPRLDWKADTELGNRHFSGGLALRTGGATLRGHDLEYRRPRRTPPRRQPHRRIHRGGRVDRIRHPRLQKPRRPLEPDQADHLAGVR